MNKKILFLVLLLPIISFAQDTASAIDERFLNSVVLLKIPLDDSLGRPIFSANGIRNYSSGTAFLLTNGKRKSSGYGKVILVTNKHMIGNYGVGMESFQLFDTVIVTFYTSDKKKGIIAILNFTDTSQHWERKIKLHPNPDVDVAAVNVSPAYIKSNNINRELIDTSWLIPYDKLKDCSCVGLGSQIFAIGYPSGIRLGTTSLPIAKSGYIASPLSKPIEIERFYLDQNGQQFYYPITGTIFLVDGLIVHGNSGSPIVTRKGIFSDYIKGQIIEMYSGRNSIIGIVSAGWDEAGLTIIYSADYILDLMRQY